MGDSHVRYWTYYLLLHLNKLPRSFSEKRRLPFNVENISFRWTDYITIIIKEIKLEINELNKEIKLKKHSGKKILY